MALTGAYLGGAAARAAAGPLDGASSELEVLVRLLDIEQLVVFSYRHIPDRIRLSASVGSTLRQFLAQELVHVHTLAAELARRGRGMPASPRSVQAVDGALAALGLHKRLAKVHNEAHALGLLQSLESLEQFALHDAIVKLSSGSLGRLAAQILTCEAQHWTVVTELLRNGNVQRAVPYAFAPLTSELKA